MLFQAEGTIWISSPPSLPPLCFSADQSPEVCSKWFFSIVSKPKVTLCRKSSYSWAVPCEWQPHGNLESRLSWPGTNPGQSTQATWAHIHRGAASDSLGCLYQLPQELSRWPQTMSQFPEVGGNIPFFNLFCQIQCWLNGKDHLLLPAASVVLPSVHKAHRWNLHPQMLWNPTDSSAWTTSASLNISISGPNVRVQRCLYYLPHVTLPSVTPPATGAGWGSYITASSPHLLQVLNFTSHAFLKITFQNPEIRPGP